jgi:hypothetical protein
MATGRRVAGRVTLDGAPAAGATVVLAARDDAAAGTAPVERVTGDDGRFDFGAQAAKRYLVEASRPTATSADRHRRSRPRRGARPHRAAPRALRGDHPRRRARRVRRRDRRGPRRRDGALAGRPRRDQRPARGPADAAGARAGDVVVAGDGVRVVGVEANSVSVPIGDRPPGSRARLTVMRGGREVALELAVGAVAP